MLNALTLLVFCQFAGEITARAASLPLPGPVLGLVFLLAGLLLRARLGYGGPSPALKSTSQGLLGHLGLLFVPAGVGVVTQFDVIGANWLPIAVSITVSTVLGLLTTGWVMQRLAGPDDEAR